MNNCIKTIAKVSFASTLAVFVGNLIAAMFIYPSFLSFLLGIGTAIIYSTTFLCTTSILAGLFYYLLFERKNGKN